MLHPHTPCAAAEADDLLPPFDEVVEDLAIDTRTPAGIGSRFRHINFQALLDVLPAPVFNRAVWAVPIEKADPAGTRDVWHCGKSN